MATPSDTHAHFVLLELHADALRHTASPTGSASGIVVGEPSLENNASEPDSDDKLSERDMTAMSMV